MALAHHPELLILDESAGRLDPGSRNDLLTKLQERAKTEIATVLFSSHNLDDVERVATRVGIIDHGRLVFKASIEGTDLRLLTRHSLDGIGAA